MRLELDHCVQAVGLNVDDDSKPWIVRNSWNTDRGEGGYIYVQQGIDACGIAKDATVVTGAKIATPSGVARGRTRAPPCMRACSMCGRM